MKKLISITLVFVVVLMFGQAKASDEWNTFSDNLVLALQCDCDGLKASAMQLIIKHADKVWVHDAAFDLYQIFKYHENERMRQLALVTLYKINNEWFLGELKKDLKDETSPAIRHQMLAILYGGQESVEQKQVFYASN